MLTINCNTTSDLKWIVSREIDNLVNKIQKKNIKNKN